MIRFLTNFLLEEKRHENEMQMIYTRDSIKIKRYKTNRLIIGFSAPDLYWVCTAPWFGKNLIANYTRFLNMIMHNKCQKRCLNLSWVASANCLDHDEDISFSLILFDSWELDTSQKKWIPSKPLCTHLQ